MTRALALFLLPHTSFLFNLRVHHRSLPYLQAHTTRAAVSDTVDGDARALVLEIICGHVPMGASQKFSSKANYTVEFSPVIKNEEREK